MIEPEREQFLQRVTMFSDLEPEELRALANVTQVVQFPASALIFREGEAGDCAYVVVRGSAQVFAIDRNGDEVVLAQLKELDHVGEQSLLPDHSGRRNASLRACEDTTLLRIPKAEFQKVLTQRHTLKELLSQEGQQQARANAIRTTRLARMWALFMFLNGFISIGILCGLAILFRTPFIFPTLGAIAFLVFFTPTTPAASPRNALCGHAVALVCGYAALWVTGLQDAGPAIMTDLHWTRMDNDCAKLHSQISFAILLNMLVQSGRSTGFPGDVARHNFSRRLHPPQLPIPPAQTWEDGTSSLGYPPRQFSVPHTSRCCSNHVTIQRETEHRISMPIVIGV